MVSCESHCILNNYWIAGWSFNSRVVKVVHIYAEGIRLVVLRFIVVGRKHFFWNLRFDCQCEVTIVRDLFWNPRFVMSTFAHRKCHFVPCFRSPNYRDEQMAFKIELILNTFQNKQSFNLFFKMFLIENNIHCTSPSVNGVNRWSYSMTSIVFSLLRMACCEALFTLVSTVKNIFKRFTFFHLQHLSWF